MSQLVLLKWSVGLRSSFCRTPASCPLSASTVSASCPLSASYPLSASTVQPGNCITDSRLCFTTALLMFKPLLLCNANVCWKLFVKAVCCTCSAVVLPVRTAGSSPAAAAAVVIISNRPRCCANAAMGSCSTTLSTLSTFPASCRTVYRQVEEWENEVNGLFVIYPL